MKLKSAKSIRRFTLLLLAIVVFAGFASFNRLPKGDLFLTFTVDTKKQHLALYWKDKSGKPLLTFQTLKNTVEKEKRRLVFAMNAGMFKPDFSPQGLYIEAGKIEVPLDTSTGSGNFYLKPNGVFYIDALNQAAVCTTSDFPGNATIRYATQSGPMLVINGQPHPAFKKGSTNLNIRNGVGILPDNKVVFVLSKNEVNFYDFAQYFISLGCKNALYLDGFVSRVYLPEKHVVQNDGRFGAMIGVTE